MEHIQHKQYLMLCAITMANSTLENTSIISFDLRKNPIRLVGDAQDDRIRGFSEMT